MGNQNSSKVGYLELRDSIPGSLVSDQDFELFYSLCKVETVRTISTLLCPSPSQLFFVVVAGEVNVQLTCPEIRHQQKSLTATLYKPGEVIHFFNAGLKVSNATGFDFGECLRNGDIKLAMHFKTTNKVAAKVIGMDRRAFEIFSVKAKCNLHTLTSFVSLNVGDIAARSPFFKTITPDQAAMLGPLLKVRLSHSGKIISPFTSEMASTAMQTSRLGSPKAKREVIAGNYTPAGPIALLLSGTALSVPYGTNLAPIIQRMASSSPTSGGILKSPLIPSLHRQKSSPKNAPPPIHYPALSEQTAAAHPVVADPESDRNRTHLTMHPGILLGLSDYYCKTPRVILRSYIASSPSILGYLDITTLDALFTVDPRFSRVIRRNYYMLIMAWLKPSVPLLRDMDEWSFALLSCKVFIKSFLAESSIYKKGETSDYAYVILGGSVKEVTESSSLKSSPNTVNTTIERVLNWGTLFGEIALATNSPYFNTTTAREPTMLLAISKKVLDQIYNNNKAKLCEIRIRLMGVEVGLQHVIDHPRGSELFHTFLAKDHAAENLQFYIAVDRFDSMCKDVRKQYVQIMRLREEALPNLLLDNSTASVAGSSTTGDNNTIVSYGTYLNAAHIVKADAQLTSREESEVNVTATSASAATTTTTTIVTAKGAGGAAAGPVGSAKNATTFSEKGTAITSAGASAAPSRASSFAYEESQKSAGSESNKSMLGYYQNSRSFGIASNPGSIDIGQLGPDCGGGGGGGDDQSTRSSLHDSNKSSHCSHRSNDSHASELLFAGALEGVDAPDNSGGSGGSGVLELHSRNLALHGHSHSAGGTHALWGKQVMKKPALESIISESNFSHFEDEDGELDGQKKFSVKHKPQSVSAYAVVSNKIALIEEGNENECDEIEETSPVRRSPTAPPATGTGNGPPPTTAETINSQGTPSAVDSATYSAHNLKLAIQTAISIAEGSPDRVNQPALPAEQEGESCVKITIASAGTSGGHNHNHSLLSVPPSSDKTQVGGGGGGSMGMQQGNSAITPIAHYTATSTGAASNLQNSLPTGAGPGLEGGSSIDSLKYSGKSTKGSVKNPPVGTTSTVAPTATTNTVHAASSGEANKVTEAALKVNCQLHRLQKNVIELKEVARTIMSTYIYNGAEQQLNLPDTMRLRTEERFEAWSTHIITNTDKAAPAAVNVRKDSFDLEPIDRGIDVSARPSPMPTKQGSNFMYTKQSSTISSISNISSGESSRNMSTSVKKLSALGGSSAVFSASAGFMASFQSGDQQDSGATTGGLLIHSGGGGGSSGGGSNKNSFHQSANSIVNIPSPIRIPDFSGNLAPIEGSTSTTPGQTLSALQRSISVDPSTVSIDTIDMTFVDLFKETKGEILKLLRDDKFPRWKATREFQTFIASVKPYEKERNSGTSGNGVEDGVGFSASGKGNNFMLSENDSRSLETPL